MRPLSSSNQDSEEKENTSIITLKWRMRLALLVGVPLYLVTSAVTVAPEGQRTNTILHFTAVGLVIYGLFAWFFSIYLRRRLLGQSEGGDSPQ